MQKTRLLAPRPDWRPLFAAQLQETTRALRRPAGEPGEGLALSPGRVLAPRWVSVYPSGQWGRGWTAPMGSNPQRPSCFRSHPRGNPTRRRIAAPGMGGSPGPAVRVRVQTCRQPSPSGLSLYLRTVEVLAFSLSNRGCSQGGERSRGSSGWSLAGPPAVFGLEVWLCSCGYGEGGTLLSWDLCKVCSPGNSPRSLTTWSRAPSPDA